MITAALFPGGMLHDLAARTAASEPANLRQDQTSAEEFGRWAFSLETLYTFKVIANPWFNIFLNRLSRNPLDHKLFTQILSARYRLTPTDGPLFLRGNLEASGGLVGTTFIEGPESYYVGVVFGGRYNFIQPRARLIPYVELRGGAGWSDAHKTREALQEEITFMYMIGAGLRYDLNSRYSVTLGVIDQHLSNAYLADPDYGFDSVGVNAGVLLRY